MNKQTNLDKFKEQMRKRLTADPNSLNLDSRIDEEPEDLYVSLAGSGRRREVVAAVSELITETLTRTDKAHVAAGARFMLRALRLCSAVGAPECAPFLKLILLEHESGAWGHWLSRLQELAARALLGLPKVKADLRFWIDVANRHETALPYALRAIIEIDLQEGLRVFWRLYTQADPQVEDPLVDWRTIIEEADEHYEEARIRRCLEETFYEVTGTTNPYNYEVYIRHWLRLPKYSRLSARTFDELPIGYRGRARPTISVPNDILREPIPSGSPTPISIRSLFSEKDSSAAPNEFGNYLELSSGPLQELYGGFIAPRKLN
jgi:hypothetical protein